MAATNKMVRTTITIGRSKCWVPTCAASGISLLNAVLLMLLPDIFLLFNPWGFGSEFSGFFFLMILIKMIVDFGQQGLSPSLFSGLHKSSQGAVECLALRHSSVPLSVFKGDKHFGFLESELHEVAASQREDVTANLSEVKIISCRQTRDTQCAQF